MNSTQDYRKYLLPEIVAKLKTLDLKARFIVNGFLIGLHKSPYHGFSAEFAQHRQYVFGDELRHIDWPLVARTEKYYIKQYEEETNLRSYILVDCSDSMRFCSSPEFIPKIEYASYLAGALAHLMIKQHDSAGLITFSDRLHTFIPTRQSTSHLTEILKALSSENTRVQTEEKRVTNFDTVFKNVAQKLRHRNLIILISDLWDVQEVVIKAMKRFHFQRNEMIVFHLLDPLEARLEYNHALRFQDMETSQVKTTNPQHIQKAYKEAFQRFSKNYAQSLSQSKIDYNLIFTSESFELALLAYLKKRSKLG